MNARRPEIIIKSAIFRTTKLSPWKISLFVYFLIVAWPAVKTVVSFHQDPTKDALTYRQMIEKWRSQNDKNKEMQTNKGNLLSNCSHRLVWINLFDLEPLNPSSPKHCLAAVQNSEPQKEGVCCKIAGGGPQWWPLIEDENRNDERLFF